MDITFKNLSVDEAKILIALAEKWQLVTEEDDPKPKRKRRTAAEMAQAKHEEEQRQTRDGPDPTPPAPRKRKKRGTADVGPAVAVANLKRGRKKRGGGVDPTPEPVKSRKRGTRRGTSTTRSPSDDEITDEDVMRVASEGAQHLTPKWVVEKLEEFGVARVDQLDQVQRYEFVTEVQVALEEAGQSE